MVFFTFFKMPHISAISAALCQRIFSVVKHNTNSLWRFWMLQDNFDSKRTFVASTVCWHKYSSLYETRSTAFDEKRAARVHWSWITCAIFGTYKSRDTQLRLSKASKHIGNHSDLANTFGIPRTTINSIITTYGRMGSVENLERSGRKTRFVIGDERGLSRVDKGNRRKKQQCARNYQHN